MNTPQFDCKHRKPLHNKRAHVYIQVSPLVVCLPVCVSFYWSSTRNVQLAILFMTNSLLHAGGTG